MKRFAAIPMVLCALGLSACGTVADTGGTLYLSTGAGLQSVNLAPTSLLEKRYDTVIRQGYDFSCGSAALATLLTYHYGLPRSEVTVFEGMWRDGDQAQIQRLGFSLLDMKRFLAAQGLSANGYTVTLEQVEQANVPGVALIAPDGYRHFVVVKGVEGDQVLLGDPSLGLRRMHRSEFLKSWSGVYFVITDGANPQGFAFNGDAQWRRLQMAPMDGGELVPLSQQALALTAPFYGEF